jgi:hypothetical protein
MKKLFLIAIFVLAAAMPVYAGPSFSGSGGGSASVTVTTDCSGVTASGALCWDSDNDTFYIGNGVSAVEIGPGSSTGDITDVWGVDTGNVNALTAASGDSLNATNADSTIPWKVATDCSAHTAEGRACWDSDDNILYVGDGSTQVTIIKSGAIVNADIAAAAAIAYSKLAALNSAQVIVGNGSNVATAVDMTGDVTISNAGVTAIGADKITEAMLKAVDSATDEDILTYESTTGDFEWHTIGNRLDIIGSTRGSVLYRGASDWAVLTPGTAAYPLLSSGAGADPAYGQLTAAGITNDTITATQLNATLTFADGDLIDLSGITQSADTNEGLILPTWANVTTTGVTNGAISWDETSKALKVKSASGWQSIGATAAPVDPTYLTLGTNATLTNERVLTEGTGIDFVDGGAGSTLTVNFDPAEITGDRTWSGGGSATVAWTWNLSSGDPTITFGNDSVSLSNSLTVATGKNVTVGSTQWNSGNSIDGTKVADADLGDITVTTGAWVVENDSHSHTSTTLPATTAYTDSASQTFTGAAQAFGDADTDTLTLRSLIVGGNSRAVWVAGSAPTPTYATGTNELYVAGDIEAGGTVYATGFQATGTGESYINLNSNASTPTGAGTNSLYVVSNAWKAKENGTEKDLVFPGDSVTWTGATQDFSSVTNFVFPTATPDANGEVGINNTNETFMVYINSGLKTFDFSSDSSGYVLKSNGSGTFTLAADETAGAPVLSSVGNPSGDTTWTFDAGEELSLQFTGAFTTGSQVLVQQQTGNPTGGILFEVRAADSDVTAFKAGDGTNGISLTQAGALTAIGTGSIQATTLSGANGETIANATDTEIKFNGTESLIVDLDTGTANQVEIKTDSGVTDLSFAALNLVTTGTMDGGIPVLKVTDATITVSGMTKYYVNSDDDVIAFNLPADPTNRAYCFGNMLYARAITLNPDDADYVVDGNDTLAAGEALISSGAKQDQLCVVGIDASYWRVTSKVGTWAQETP